MYLLNWHSTSALTFRNVQPWHWLLLSFWSKKSEVLCPLPSHSVCKSDSTWGMQSVSLFFYTPMSNCFIALVLQWTLPLGLVSDYRWLHLGVHPLLWLRHAMSQTLPWSPSLRNKPSSRISLSIAPRWRWPWTVLVKKNYELLCLILFQKQLLRAIF